MSTFKKYILATAFIMISAVSLGQEENKNDDVAYAIIENAPVYPGCEMFSDNVNLKNCMTKKVTEHVSNNFEIGIARTLNLHGKQRISVQYKVDKNGKVVDVLSRAPHPKLEKEAKRVINMLPQMKPGMQKGKPVGVLYSLPIVFEVESKTTKAQRKALKKLERKNKRKNNN